jgi:hypothetical protein
MRIFRRKIAARRLNVSASALRRQWAPGKASAAAENSQRHLGFVIPAARLPWAAPLAKRVTRDNQVRALINPAGRRELECPLQVSAPQASQRVERKSPKREHLHQGHNSFGAIFTAAPEKNSGAAFFLVTDATKRVRCSGACAKHRIYGKALDTSASTQESGFEPDDLPLPGPFVPICD